MSFLLKKIINTWNATKEESGMVALQTPVCPPTPDFSHLTPDEVNAIHDVIMRQEEFERQEEGRVRKLREELDSIQRQLCEKSSVSSQDKKLVDLHLCRLCFKTKFDEGAGMVCDDCQQRVCQQCGAFSRSRGSVRRTKIEGQWRCKLCMARRDVLCRTGGWYHGTPADSTQELKMRLSVTSSPDGENETKNITGYKSKMVDIENCPSGNRTDSSLLGKMSASENLQQPTPMDHPHRQSLLPDIQGLENKNDDQMEGDKNSLKKLMLERQTSRQRRQEKLQRQRLKTGVKKPQVFDESRGDSAEYSDTNSSTFSSFSDSGRSTFSSPTALKVTQQGSVTNTNIRALTRQRKSGQNGWEHIVSADPSTRHSKLDQEGRRHTVTTDASTRHSKLDQEGRRHTVTTDASIRHNKLDQEGRRHTVTTDASTRHSKLDQEGRRHTVTTDASTRHSKLDQEGRRHTVTTDASTRHGKLDQEGRRHTVTTDASTICSKLDQEGRRHTVTTDASTRHSKLDQEGRRHTVTTDASTRHGKLDQEGRRHTVTTDASTICSKLDQEGRRHTVSTYASTGYRKLDQEGRRHTVTTDASTICSKLDQEGRRHTVTTDASTICSKLDQEGRGHTVTTDVSIRHNKLDQEGRRHTVTTDATTGHSKLDQEKRGHIVSIDRKRKTSRESHRSQSTTDLRVKVLLSKSPDRQTFRESGERSLQKWRQSGFPEAYLIVLHCQPKGRPFGLKVTGGVQDDPADTRAVVSWVSSEIKASICEGEEVLEWNGKILRGQTYDFVSSVTSQECPRAFLLVNPTKERKESKPVCVGGTLSPQDDPLKQDSDLQMGKSRILPWNPTDSQQDSCQVKGEIQIKMCYQPETGTLSISVLRAKYIVSSDMSEPGGCRTFVIISLVPGSGRASLETELQTSPNNPEWNQTFVLSGVSLTEMTVKAVQMTVWSRDERCDRCDRFKGEVLLDLTETQLDDQAHWYSLEEHDENSSPLPNNRRNSLATNSANWTSLSYKDSPIMCPTLSPEVPTKRNSSPSTGSSNVSPVPFGTSQNVSTELHLSNESQPTVSQPDSFTDKVKKKMRKTVSKMSPLSFMEKKDNAGSDDSMCSEVLRRLSSKSDKSGPVSRSPKLQKSTYIFTQNLDLLAPPRPPSRTSSCSSLFMSDDEDIPGPYCLPPMSSDRPAPDGDDITSTLGPGQIPPKPSAETTVCGAIRLGFMVTKGQLEVDIICAASLHWDRQIQPPDTFVKTYLVEGKKVIQSKKTNIVKTSADPSYHKKIKYSASNVHGRIMKIVVWKRASSADKKICLGEVLVRLDILDLSKPTVGWYKLFKMNSTEYGSDEFLASW